jgi:hypothetical protein
MDGERPRWGVPWKSIEGGGGERDPPRKTLESSVALFLEASQLTLLSEPRTMREATSRSAREHYCGSRAQEDQQGKRGPWNRSQRRMVHP